MYTKEPLINSVALFFLLLDLSFEYGNQCDQDDKINGPMKEP